MNPTRLAITLLGATLSLTAQDSYWIANRASLDIMRVSSWGSVLERVATPTTLRSCHVAPNGKVWIVRFGSATFDIYDPTTATMTAVLGAGGSIFQMAFDAAGHAWLSNGGTQVHEYDASGTFVQTITMPVNASLGITVDASGNKWVAHRAAPASVSRIDPAGVVTNFPIVGATTLLPVNVLADYRGIGNPSRIWVTGDSANQLAEVDAVTGATLNLYTLPLPTGGLSAPTFDRAGRIWVGAFGGTTLLQVDETSGTPLQTLTFPPSTNGLTTDHLGRIRQTARVTFSGVGPPCEVRRIDATTGTLEIPTLLQFGGFSSTGTQSAMSTLWQYSLVVAPTGDMDGDGEANVTEILNGTSPIDANSTSTFRIESFGSTQNGSTPTFEVQAGATLWVVGFAGALTAPTSIPGFGGLLRLDLATLVSTAAGVGNASLPIAIPANPALAGFEFFAQGATYNGVSFDFRNVTGMLVW